VTGEAATPYEKPTIGPDLVDILRGMRPLIDEVTHLRRECTRLRMREVMPPDIAALFAGADAVALHPGRTSAQLAGCCSLDRYQIARRLPEAEQAGDVHRRPPASLEPGSRPAYTWWPGPAPVAATPPAPVTRADGQVVLL